MFAQGGATLQFASIPLNTLGGAKTKTDYLITGQWGEKAHQECGKYSTGQVACNTKSSKFTCIPKKDEWKLRGPHILLFHFVRKVSHDIPTLPLMVKSLLSSLFSYRFGAQDGAPHGVGQIVQILCICC